MSNKPFAEPHNYFFEYSERGGKLSASKFYIEQLIKAMESGDLHSTASQVILEMTKQFVKEELENI